MRLPHSAEPAVPADVASADVAAADCDPQVGVFGSPIGRHGQWFVLLWAPLLLAAHLIPAVLDGRWLAVALLTAVGASFVLAVVTFHHPPAGRTGDLAPFTLLLVQGMLTAVAVPVVADDASPGFLLLPLLVITVSVIVHPRLAPGGICSVATIAAGAALLAGWPVGTVVWLSLTTLLSGLGSYAMQRMAATVTELNRTRRQLADAAVAAERLRFSRDLHDLLGHSLSVIVVKAEAIRRLAEADPAAAAAHGADIEELGRSALAEVREAVAGYREGSLADELSRAAAALRAGGIRAEVTPAPEHLRAETQALLGWVVREGVTNVLRHSGARSCRILVGTDDGNATVTVSDDGRGAGTAYRPGSGLQGLSERVRSSGGRIGVGASPQSGPGFVLRADVPLPVSSVR